MRVLVHICLLLGLANFAEARPINLTKAERDQMMADFRKKVVLSGETSLADSKYDKAWDSHYRAFVVSIMTTMRDLPEGTDQAKVNEIWRQYLTDLRVISEKIVQEAAEKPKPTEDTQVVTDGNQGPGPVQTQPGGVDTNVNQASGLDPATAKLAEELPRVFVRRLADVLKEKNYPVGIGVAETPTDTTAVLPPPSSQPGVLPSGLHPHHPGQPPPNSVGAGLVDQTNQFLTSNYPRDPYGWIQSGQTDMEKQNYKGAFSNFGRALELDRKNADALFGYGSAAFNLGDTRLAARTANHALEISPGHKGALTLLKLSENRAPEVTLPNVLDANHKPGDLNITPNADPGVRSGTMAAVPRSMTPAEIAAAAQRQANAPPTAVQQSAALTQQAAAAMAVRDFSKAEEVLTQAIALNGRNAEAYNARAIAENKLGKYNDAIHDASFALGLVPGSAAALQTRSWAFAQAGRFQEALGDANYSLERDPSNAYAYYNRAFALAGLQERDGALESLKKAAELDHRFQQTYQQALEAPKESDLVFLFADVGAQKSAPAEAPAQAPGSRQKRFTHLMLISVLGGGLVALGLLHIFSARWRQTVSGTLRRLTGAAPAEGSEENADGFWSGYTVTREIGSGGMGVVYEATDSALARRVAIKKMRDEVRSDPEERRRFLAEARTVATLHHPSIVDIYSIVEDSGDIYLVFEFVDGRTVHEFLGEKGPLALADAKRIMMEACDAVSYAHQQGVIHRDLKPSNIMLAANGRVKVMDFGVARQAQEALSKVAQTNTIVGTPPYMAPEQEQGTVRRESDVFALGVCFYEMLSGRLPFAGQGAGMLLNKMNGKHIPLSQVVSGLPAGVDEVVAKALAPDPEQRYHTPEEFSAALQGLQG